MLGTLVLPRWGGPGDGKEACPALLRSAAAVAVGPASRPRLGSTSGPWGAAKRPREEGAAWNGAVVRGAEPFASCRRDSTEAEGTASGLTCAYP